MRNSRKFLTLVVLVLMLLPFVVHAQDELSGELTVSFWGNVDAYEQGNSDNRPWQAVYDLIKEWDEMHPNVTVTFISQPIDGIYDRVRTQLISGTLPDLVAMYPTDQMLEGNLDLVYNLTDDLAKKNPYGSFDTWQQEFWYDLNIGTRSPAIPAGQVYFVGNSLPSNIGQMVIYYNKTDFATAGISEKPETFADLINACTALRDKGLTPLFADAASGPSLSWFSSWIGEQMLDPVVQQIADAFGVPNENNFITEEMMAWAVSKGVLTGDNPYVLETARLMKDLQSNCFNEDWQAADSTVDYFLTKKVSMIHNGFWVIPQYAEADRDFDFGSFVFPLITKDSSDLATVDQVRRWGGLEGGEVGDSFFIPTTTVDNGKLPLALDLLQYITARPSNDKWCEPQFPPCVPRDQDINDVITDPVVADEVYGFYNPPMSPDTIVRGIGNSDWTPDGVFLRLLNLYMADNLTIEDFGTQLQDEYSRWAESTIVDHPNWDMANWPEPQ